MPKHSFHVGVRISAMKVSDVLADFDVLAEAMAALEERDRSILDWSVGFDGHQGLMEIDMTIEADKYMDALTHGSSMIQDVTGRTAISQGEA